ncbi:SurA N-terminal domain-containing protein [Acidovorax sp. Be4]|uniref:Periplasmic chaperone PpiD n=1 Tax=Acidovorax bellezanensis TaxID=2976702 RepID=A0ABT2PUJ5_9BURK|nr:SurA N-terminal domain-containing protein [Acidovorax sp. Be4]MCT9812813.1 SurA N-terminal domain-containing protein [Acidovorax sp. Be4]
MFEAIRKHSKFVMILLFLLIIPSFIFVGIDQNYFSESSPTVARVNGNDIKQSDWDNAHRAQSDEIRAANPGIDAKLLDTPQARYATLERMVRDRVLAAAAQKMHLVTSDAQLVRTLQQIPAIAALKRADGTLDAQAYRALVGAQGMTPEGFEANLRSNLSVSQVLGSVLNSSFATDAEVKLAMDALYQRREVQVAQFSASDFAAKVKPTPEELQAYYKAHPDKFQQAEQADVEYVVLDTAGVQASMVLNEDDLQTYYKENLARLAGQEERRASHILINVSKEASADDRAKARAQAQALLEQLRKEPSSFAAVAKKSSQDSGTATNGGDLGFFARGAMVKPFEDAAFALKKGEISDVVESDFGFHIIQLTDIKTPPQPSFAEVRPRLEKELKEQQAQRKFAEAAEQFANSVYEQSDNLQAVAEKLKLPVQTAKAVARVPAAGVQGPLANPRFLEALFSADSLASKRNTDAVEISPGVMVAGRIVSYSPAHTLPYEAVAAKVQTLYVAQKAAELAREEGQAKLKAWKEQPASVALNKALVVGRDQTEGLSRAIIDAALHAPVDALPAWVGVDLGDQGYAVVKVNAIVARPAQDAQAMAAQKQQYAQLWANAEAAAYYELLKTRFKVQIKVDRP